MVQLIRVWVWLSVFSMGLVSLFTPGLLTCALWEIANKPANDFSFWWSYLSGAATVTSWLYFAFYLFNPIYKIVNYKIGNIGVVQSEQRTKEIN